MKAVASSPGCAAGEYHAGALVTLTADPDREWTVGSWTGTDNNASHSQVNTFTIPATAHSSAVHYVEVIFADGFESGDTSAWPLTWPPVSG